MGNDLIFQYSVKDTAPPCYFLLAEEVKHLIPWDNQQMQNQDTSAACMCAFANAAPTEWLLCGFGTVW